MADARPPFVEALRVDAVKRVHAPPEIRLRRLDQEMHVVRHQAVSKAVPAEVPDDPAQQSQIPPPIVVVEKDQPPLNAARKHMPDAGLRLIPG
jgi:hypothetical protein